MESIILIYFVLLIFSLFRIIVDYKTLCRENFLIYEILFRIFLSIPLSSLAYLTYISFIDGDYVGSSLVFFGMLSLLFLVWTMFNYANNYFNDPLIWGVKMAFLDSLKELRDGLRWFFLGERD